MATQQEESVKSIIDLALVKTQMHFVDKRINRLENGILAHLDTMEDFVRYIDNSVPDETIPF